MPLHALADGVHDKNIKFINKSIEMKSSVRNKIIQLREICIKLTYFTVHQKACNIFHADKKLKIDFAATQRFRDLVRGRLISVSYIYILHLHLQSKQEC